jgi:hypothetical protein
MYQKIKYALELHVTRYQKCSERREKKKVKTGFEKKLLESEKVKLRNFN